MKPGTLRIYLGAAPGVGKTYAMLAEGRRRAARGTDVVIGLVETHGRALTADMAQGLDEVPRRRVEHRGAMFEELDLPALLARRPQVALVDELAHTNADETGHAKRWQDVEDLLAAGVNVISTLNIQHLASLNEVVTQITGVKQHETIPDAIVRRAEQVELVDMTAEALRRRMVHGNIYPPDRIDAALTHYFRPGNLTALRELALLWMADRTEEGLRAYRSAHDIAAPWETRERVVLGLAGTPDEADLVRHVARTTQRIPGAELLAVHVAAEDGLARTDPDCLEQLRDLVESLSGSFDRVTGEDVALGLVHFARAHQATQVVLGRHAEARRPRFVHDIADRVLRDCPHIDVHIVGHGVGKQAQHARPQLARSARRRAILTEAEAIRALSVGMLQSRHDLPSLLEELRLSLDLQAAGVLEANPEGAADAWHVIASAGEHCPETPAAADAVVPMNDTTMLVVRGAAHDPAVRGALSACAQQLRTVRDRLAEADIARDEHRHGVRATLAVVQLVLDHELRPRIRAAQQAARDLAKRSATSDNEHEQALRSLDSALSSIEHRVENLLELCRVDTGGLDLQLRPVEIDDAVEATLEDLGPGGHQLTVDLPEDLPDAIADADALSRALTALSAQALRSGDHGSAPVLSACAKGDRVLLTLSVRTAQAPDEATGTPPRDQSLAVRLSRGLIEAMGGAIRLDQDVDGGGYAVGIDLPAALRRSGDRPIG